MEGFKKIIEEKDVIWIGLPLTMRSYHFEIQDEIQLLQNQFPEFFISNLKSFIRQPAKIVRYLQNGINLGRALAILFVAYQVIFICNFLIFSTQNMKFTFSDFNQIWTKISKKIRIIFRFPLDIPVFKHFQKIQIFRIFFFFFDREQLSNVLRVSI